MRIKKIIGASLIVLFSVVLLVACNRNTYEVDQNKVETGSFTDQRDGKIYKTVKIADHWILAENFAYKPDTGNFWVYEDNESNIALYGYLYDWETAMNITPDGWHLPSRDEWDEVRKALGGKMGVYYYHEKVYPKLIVGGSSGLNMKLGGIRTCSGKYKFLNDKVMFWNSNISGSEKIGVEHSVYGLNSNKENVPHGLFMSTAPYMYNNGHFLNSCSGFNVRLFKD